MKIGYIIIFSILFLLYRKNKIKETKKGSSVQEN
nr:MAG TPA: Plasma membrane calcium-transporting ATPase 1 protein, STRUCTURAL PROTEIN [Bacteriophage sp.]